MKEEKFPFKPDCMVECVRPTPTLTVGKAYHVSMIVGGQLQVKNDNGRVVRYSPDRFQRVGIAPDLARYLTKDHPSFMFLVDGIGMRVKPELEEYASQFLGEDVSDLVWPPKDKKK